MATLLQWENLAWIALVLAALLALLTMAKATRHAAKRRHELPIAELMTAAERQEHTQSRWSRIVKQSHSVFWVHVSDRKADAAASFLDP